MEVPLIFLSNKQISNILNCSPAKASREVQNIKNILNIKHRKQITLAEFLEFNDLPLEQVLTKLY